MLSQLMASILVDYILLNEEEYMFGELWKRHKQPLKELDIQNTPMWNPQLMQENCIIS